MNSQSPMKHTRNSNTDGIQVQCSCSACALLTYSVLRYGSFIYLWCYLRDIEYDENLRNLINGHEEIWIMKLTNHCTLFNKQTMKVPLRLSNIKMHSCANKIIKMYPSKTLLQLSCLTHRSVALMFGISTSALSMFYISF